MRMFVQSLQRLYSQQKITIEQVQARLTAGIIKQEEFDFITGQPSEE